MPLYEYSCPRCGERFEILQRTGEGGDHLSCPRCGARGAERRVSTFASRAAGYRASSRGCEGGSGFG